MEGVGGTGMEGWRDRGMEGRRMEGYLDGERGMEGWLDEESHGQMDDVGLIVFDWNKVVSCASSLTLSSFDISQKLCFSCAPPAHTPYPASVLYH